MTEEAHLYQTEVKIEGSEEELPFLLKLVAGTYKSADLGSKATISCRTKGADSQEFFKDEVKLWNAKSREAFAEKCIKTFNADLSSEEAQRVRKTIDAQLRQ